MVVTVRNEVSTIDSLLEALARQTRPADEVIIVDGGSTDGTAERASAWAGRLPRLQVLRAPGADIARGRNIGIRRADSELIAVTDGGCIPSPQWVEALYDRLRDPAVRIVQGEVEPNPSSSFEACVARCSLTPGIRIGGHTLNPTARSLAFRKEVWERSGGFPEDPPFNRAEDGVFIQRAASEGGLVLEPRARVGWRPRGSYRAVFRQFHDYARGLAQLGASRTFHARTLAQSLALLSLLIVGFLSPVAWIALLAGTAAYLVRKAKEGCFAVPSWRTSYRVPLILATIHLGTMAGIIHGTMRRVVRRRGSAA